MSVREPAGGSDTTGGPVITGTRIPTSIVAERFIAGESIDELADDYGREKSEIEEAIRYEHVAA